MFEGIPMWAPNVTATGALIVIALLAVTGKLVWHRWVERQIAAVEARSAAAIASAEKQRDDAVSALREAHEVARINAESIRELTDSVEKLADGQEVAVNLIRAALPSPMRGGA